MTTTTTTQPQTSNSSPPVKLSEVAPPRVTIKCMDVCGVMTRVYRVQPSTAIGAYKFCPVCGSENIGTFMSSDTDWWEAMARDYGMSVEMMQVVYKGWNPHEHYRFADYVAAMRAQTDDE